MNECLFFFDLFYRISHFGQGISNRSKKKAGGGETPEDEIMLVESS